MTTYPIPAGAAVLTAPTHRHASTGALVPAVVADPQPADIALVDGTWPFIRSADGTEKQFRPPVEAGSPAPRMLTPNQVIDLMLATIGAAGFAACVRSDADAMVAWRYKMSVARDISKDQAAAGLSIIVGASLMTAEQRTAILAAWPTT